MRFYAIQIASAVSIGMCGLAVAQPSTTSLIRTGVPLAPDVAPNGDILYPPMSYDGRYIAFHSTATNLVPDDRNNVGDVFIVDREARLVKRLSLGTGGSEANGTSTYPSIAGEAGFVAFTSDASNLTPEDQNESSDVFLANVETGDLALVSRRPDGKPASGRSYNYFPSISADGRYVVFNSNAPDLISTDTNETWDVFVFDRLTNQVELISRSTSGAQGNGPSMHGVISGNGRFVAFQSRATNLVADNTNNVSQIYLHDRQSQETRLISRTPDGAPGNGRSERASISHDGLRVSFSSDASNLVPNDTNGIEDVFVYDQGQPTSLRRVSVTTGGGQIEQLVKVAMDRKSVISPDGTAVAFRSGGDNLASIASANVDIYLHTIATVATERLSSGPGGAQIVGNSEHHALSYDASLAAFSVIMSRPNIALNASRLGIPNMFSVSPDGGAPTAAAQLQNVSLGFIVNRQSGRTSLITE